jgi:HTH-type transcriptional regulator/antitoxin HigA
MVNEIMIAQNPIAAPSGLDVKAYGRLLAKFAPKVIQNEAENEAALAIVEGLILKGDSNCSPEEEAALELLSSLVARFEETAYPIPDVEPREVLQHLMEHNDPKAGDLSGIFGSRARVSEVLSGKRSISKEQAKRLAERFKLSPAVFV